MLQNRFFRYLLVVILIGFLVAIRTFESVLFYDPFIAYFKSEFHNQLYPKYDALKLFLNIGTRYLINSMVSLGIIYVIFTDSSKVKMSSVLLSLFFLILMGLIIVLLCFFTEKQAMILFYVRRFLIQPIFLLLFIPAFYYQQRNYK
ncbi:MAG: exosortase F system-associated protein [Limnohabitans sp.]|nr:exosortase F system-associated protein [Limnohabitans sp.]